MDISIILLGMVVTIITQISKQVDKIPVTSNNAKIVALGLGFILVGIYEYVNAGIRPELAGVYATEIITVAVSAIGFYEAGKRIIK